MPTSVGRNWNIFDLLDPSFGTYMLQSQTPIVCAKFLVAIVISINLLVAKSLYVNNTVVLTIVSLKYTVPVDYSAYLSILIVPYLHI